MKPLPMKQSRIKLTILIFLAVVTFSSANIALAQDEAIQHYEVEIVIYKNIKVPKSKEYILPVSSPRRDNEIFDLSSVASIEAAKKKQYRVVPTAGLRLTDIVANIAKSSRYELLIHTAWRQPGLDKSETLPIWVKSGHRFGNEFISIDDKIELLQSAQDEIDAVSSANLNETNLAQADEQSQRPNKTGLYELEGKITVALSRYLHVYTDIVLRKPRLSTDAQLETVNTNQRVLENLSDSRILDNHRMKEHRRMRSETLHYLDSPEFSMLVFITPYEPPIQTSSAVTQSEGAIASTIILD
ncbi:MAG: hypothetical protein ACI9KN_002031 [Gammaproteobacteria bacterium]|jgi:hypothetical protein